MAQAVQETAWEELELKRSRSELKGWLSGYVHLLLLQTTWVQVPPLTHMLQLSVTPVPGDPPGTHTQGTSTPHTRHKHTLRKKIFMRIK